MAEKDTTFRAGESRFPATAWSLLSRLRDSSDPRVREYLNRMFEMYWRPVYKYIRIAWKRSNEDAKDLTQAFFVHLLEGDLLAKADPERGNFRKLLMVSLRNFLSNDARSLKAEKRGGGRAILPLEGDPDDASASDPADPQLAFEAQWAREVLGRSIDLLGERLRPEAFHAFKRFHLEGAAVKEIAAETGARESQVSHYLQDARTALRRIVTDMIREYVQEEAEIARELETLFQGWR